MGNYSKGIAGTIVVVLLLSGFYFVQSNVQTKLKNSARDYITAELDKWKDGKLGNGLFHIMLSGFNGTLREWKDYKLTDYFIEDMKVGSKYISRRRHGIMYYFYKLSSSNMYVYADVELDMEDTDGYPKTFNIRYRLEPRGNGDFLVSKASRLKLF